MKAPRREIGKIVTQEWEKSRFHVEKSDGRMVQLLAGVEVPEKITFPNRDKHPHRRVRRKAFPNAAACIAVRNPSKTPCKSRLQLIKSALY